MIDSFWGEETSAGSEGYLFTFTTGGSGELWLVASLLGFDGQATVLMDAAIEVHVK